MAQGYADTIIEKLNKASNESNQTFLNSLNSNSIDTDLENWFKSLDRDFKLLLFNYYIEYKRKSQEEEGE